ncbi:MAG: HNH endonuclease [Gammaproteobacteria bacterium]|nr:HNH endonuclease [Gammaproteobacteria bacterium]
MAYAEDRALIYNKYDGHCAYCGKKIDLDSNWAIDHIQPRAHGGSNKPDNYNPACFQCNMAKLAKTPDEWRESMGLQSARQIRYWREKASKFFRHAYGIDGAKIDAAMDLIDAGCDILESMPVQFFMDTYVEDDNT